MNYLLDTNAILRVFLHDNIEQAKWVEDIILRADKNGEQIVVILPVITELVYTLTASYGIPKENIIQMITEFISHPTVYVHERGMVLDILKRYEQYPISIVDVICMTEALRNDWMLISFDKQLVKVVEKEKKKLSTRA